MTGTPSTIFDLTDLATALAAGDVIAVVDISDTTGNPDGTTKKISITNLFGNIPVNMTIERALSGRVILTTSNTLDSSGADAQNIIKVGGTSAGDPILDFSIVGGALWRIGTDNSDNDIFKINSGAFGAGTGDLQLTTAGNLKVAGTLIANGAAADVSGSRGGNAALADLLTELATIGLIVDSTSA